MRIKEIKKINPGYDISMIDVVRMLDPSKGGKFVKLLLKEVIESEKNMVMFSSELDKLDIDRLKTPYYAQQLLSMVCDSVGGVQSILDLTRFDTLCDEGHVTDKDVQNYNTLGDISVAVLDAETNKSGNKLVYKSEVVIEDDEWLVIKPLNMNASRKYGAATKWCTTQRDNYYFYDYSNRGVVLYILSKTSNVKWALFYELKSHSLSWWNSVDDRVDGLLVNLPQEFKTRLVDYVITEPNPNTHYFDQEDIDEGKKHNASHGLDDIVDEVFMLDDVDAATLEDVMLDDIESIHGKLTEL